VSSESLVVAVLILSFALIIAGATIGSAVGDGIVSSKAVEAIARQPEARGNIFTFLFIGVGLIEAFPIIALVLAFYLLLVVAPVQSLVHNITTSATTAPATTPAK
jgi:F-type H+-transporting ATPase subunit c